MTPFVAHSIERLFLVLKVALGTGIIGFLSLRWFHTREATARKNAAECTLQKRIAVQTNAKMAEAYAEITRLRKTLASRFLSQDQYDVIVHRLKYLPEGDKSTVWIQFADDAHGLANYEAKIRRALSAAGLNLRFSQEPIQATNLVVTNVQLPIGKTISDALSEANIDHLPIIGDFCPNVPSAAHGAVQVIIGIVKSLDPASD